MNTRYAVDVQGLGVLPDDFPTFEEADAVAERHVLRFRSGVIRRDAVAFAYTPPEDDQ